MLDFFKKEENKKVEKYSKYDQISPVPFIRLAQKSPAAASNQLRERYEELSDYADSHAIFIYKDPHLKDWHTLANLLTEHDFVLAKSIFMPLLETHHAHSEHEIPDDLMPDYRLVAQQLYDLEEKIPEKKDTAKLSLLYVLVNYGFKDQPFWQGCLEDMFDLAVKLINHGEEYAGMVAVTAFYAENDSELQMQALNTFRFLLMYGQLFKPPLNPDWQKACLIQRSLNFCIQKHYVTRNLSFPANPDSKLCKLLYEIFWALVERKLEENSADTLLYLQMVMQSDAIEVAYQAAEVYKKHFEFLAKADPIGATENLRSLAVFSNCNYHGSDTNHQNDLLMDVFDVAIEALYLIDKALAQKPFCAYMGPHRSMAGRVLMKHKNKITRWV